MVAKRIHRKVDHVIVGAGPIGLLHALKCSRMGQKVLVLERAGQIGGQWRCHQHQGAIFENGFHFIHHPAQWNEFLFDINVDLPLSKPTEPPLIFDGKKWKPLTGLPEQPAEEQPYLQTGLPLVKGGMAPWLRSLAEENNIEIAFNESLQSLECEEEFIRSAHTTRSTIEATQWTLTGNSQNYTDLFSAPVLKQHTVSGIYPAAICFQFLMRKPLVELRSVHVIKHKMDHQEHRFLGLFDSNLDPTRAPEGRQITTWMCFLTPEEFEDTSALTRWRRALKRSLNQAWEGFDQNVLWERFSALAQAGGPHPRTKEKLKHAAKPQWGNCHFLTHVPLYSHDTPYWTTQQLVQASSVDAAGPVKDPSGEEARPH